VHGLGLVEALLEVVHVLRRHTALRQVDIPLVFVHTEHQSNRLAAYIDLWSRKFGKERG